MKKFMAKMRKVRMSPWNMLSAGEKVMKVAMKLVKIAAIVAVVAGLFSVFVVLGVAVLMLFVLGGGFVVDPYDRR